MTTETILAGFGGQGILFAGKLLAYAGMISEKEISWLPSYGPEMRGGTANCHVIISDEPVASPMVINPDVLIAMNSPSKEKFINAVNSGGVMVIDSSLVTPDTQRTDIKIGCIPATTLAHDMGAPKLANVIITAHAVKLSGVVSFETLKEAMKKCTPAGKEKLLLEMNIKALEMGYEYE